LSFIGREDENNGCDYSDEDANNQDEEDDDGVADNNDVDDDDDAPLPKRRRDSRNNNISKKKSKKRIVSGDENSPQLAREVMDLSSYEKVEKMKKIPKSVKPSVLYNDDSDLENNAHECGKGKILKSKQKKKHKKRLDVNASSSIFDEDSCMDVSISQKGSQQKVQYTTEAMSLANDFPVTKKHSAQLSECEESTNMDPTDALPKGKRKKKRVIKSSQNKLTLDDPFPILGKDECMLFSGGFEVDSDDMLPDTSAKNDTSVPQSSKNKQNLEGKYLNSILCGTVTYGYTINITNKVLLT